MTLTNTDTAVPTEATDDARISIERGRLEVERAKLELESVKAKREARFLVRNSAAIIGALVSFAAVVVSATQVYTAVAERQRSKEVALGEQSRTFELARQQREGELRLAAVKLILENRDAVYSSDADTRAKIAWLIGVAFPPNIAEQLAGRIADTAPSAVRQEWLNVQRGFTVKTTPDIFSRLPALQDLITQGQRLLDADSTTYEQVKAWEDRAKNFLLQFDRRGLPYSFYLEYWRQQKRMSNIADLPYFYKEILVRNLNFLRDLRAGNK